MQSKRRSWLESIAGTAGGMAYAIPLNYVMITRVAWPDWWTYAIVNTVFFMILGTIFKFVVRRAFNWWDVRYPTI